MKQITAKILSLLLFLSIPFLHTTQILAAESQTTNHFQVLPYWQFTKYQTDLSSKNAIFYDAFSRATNRVDLTVGANQFIKANSVLSLEIDETVKFNFSYSPQNALLEVGLVGPDGNFHYIYGNNGTLKETIVVNKTGKYHLAFRNRSNNTVQVMGFIYY